MEVTLVWVAIIAASSGLIGVAISGIVTTKQSNTQMKMHRNTLQQQTDEARRDRIVAARKPLLIELRESLSRALGAFITLSSVIVIQDPNKPLDLTHIVAPQRILKDAMELTIQLINQNSDTTLISAIDVYMTTFQAILSATDLIEIEAIKKLQDTTTLTTARLQLILVNKRIEELLTGEDPTEKGSPQGRPGF